MCIIVYNKDGKSLDKAQMRIAYDNNPHGFGLMWYDRHTKRIRTMKRHDSDFDNLWDILQKLSGVTYALHLRWRTRGADSLAQCHPHKVVSKDDGAPEDVFLMHNGTFSAFAKHDKKSDTKLFAQKLRTIMRGSRHAFEKSLNDMKVHVNSFDRLLFMHSTGKVTFVNGSKGDWIDGVWYSNTYSFEEGYRDPAPGHMLSAHPGFKASDYFYSPKNKGSYRSSYTRQDDYYNDFDNFDDETSSSSAVPYWKDPSPPKVYRGLALGMPATSMKKKKLANKKAKRAENKAKKVKVKSKASLELLHGENGSVERAAPGYYIDGKGRRTYVTASGATIRIR